MSTTKYDTEGSWLLCICGALGGLICLILTGLIVAHFGESLGATASGRQLLGWASVLVHVLGFVVMGLALGHFWKTKVWSWATISLVIFLAAGGYTITGIMGFVATERISKAKSAQDAIKDKADRKKNADEAAKQRQESQERLAKTQLGFMQAELKDASGKERRVLQKNFAGDAAKLIAEVGKDPSTEKAPSNEITMRPDAQVEQLSEMTSIPPDVVQLTLMAWLAILLVSVEGVLWPMASYSKPRRIPVDLGVDKRTEAPALGAVVGTPLIPIPEPTALIAAAPIDVPVVRELAPKVPEPVPGEPETVAIPTRLILLSGADLWLKSKGFELLSPRPGPLKDWVSKKQPAECLACWMQAHGLLGPFSHIQMSDLLSRMCTAYHKKQPAWNVFAPEFEKIRSIEVKKIRIDGQESPRPKRWYVASADRDIKKFAKESDPKQEASPDTGPRPLARTSAQLPEAAANDNRKKVQPAWIEMQRVEARQEKAWMQQNSHRSRKQRGARVGRMARAA